MEGVAFEDAPTGEQDSPPDTVPFDCLAGVLGTGRREPTVGRKQGGDDHLVEADDE